MRPALSPAVAAALLAACAALVIAWTGQADAAPAKKAAAGLQITLTNHRPVAVTSIGFMPQGAERGAKNLLASPLPSGQSRVLRVPARKGECVFDVLGSYQDEIEISGSGLDLCRDKTLVLVD